LLVVEWKDFPIARQITNIISLNNKEVIKNTEENSFGW
jgi:hypothetical protein